MPADRELIAQREIGHTDIAPWLSRTLTAVFLATIAVVPAIQTAYDLGQWRRGERAGALPQSVDALRLPAVGLRTSISAEGSPLARIFAADREMLRAIHSFEDALEERSRVGAFIRPRVQRVLTEKLGAGNEQVYCGRSGWLFFRPAVDHLMGPGFIDERELAWAADRGDELGEPRHSDPMPAILEFRNQLANRGIELLLVPVPVKAAVYPELLSERYAGGGEPLSNPSFANFLAELADRQVRVLDPTPLIAEAKESDGELQYLRTDTHWTPRAVDLVADRLATTVRGLVDLEQMDAVRYTGEAANIRNTGDLAEMLELPTLFPPQEVRINVVRNADGTPWRRRRSAEVLLLGDSFTNIYSQEGLGWGAGAGLAERLSYHLQRPVDALVRNDDGAIATRLLLSREVAQEHDRLAGVRLVIWEFAARELSVGDWRLVAMDTAPLPEGKFIVPPRGAAIVVEGTVAALAEVPDPRIAPYADYIVGLHLVDVTSDEALEGDQALVFTWAMRGRRLTAGAGYRVGQRLRLELRPWADVTRELESVARGELYENNLLLQTPCWGEEISP